MRGVPFVPTAPLEVEGMVELMVSNREPHDCLCCPGPHVFCYSHELDEYEGAYPWREGRDVSGLMTDFLRQAFQENGYELDGRRIRVTVELLDE